MSQQLGSNYYNSPYKFNGKELDEETGFYYYGARYYDPRISIWQSVDPLAEKMPNFSPYTYCSQNPINRIDPDGKKDYNFDKDGNYIGKTNDNWWHNLWHGSRGSSLDSSGKKSYFKFASGKDDTNSIDKSKKENVHLYKLSANNIKEILAKAGVYRKENKGKNSVGFMLQEGVGGGALDYANSTLDNYEGCTRNSHNISPAVFFLPQGEETAHNQSNFGNFLVGASAQALGVGGLSVIMGAEYNSRYNENGYNGGNQWDSQDDLDSIGMGYQYSLNVLNDIVIKNTQQGPIISNEKKSKTRK